jgi:hypothetical protein
MKLQQQQQQQQHNLENPFQDEKCPFESALAIKSHSDDGKCNLLFDEIIARKPFMNTKTASSALFNKTFYVCNGGACITNSNVRKQLS